MSKKQAIERANKRLLNENLPPPVTFTEHEVIEMINEIIGLDLSKMNSTNPTPEDLKQIFEDKEINTTKFKVEEAFRNALRKKGRIFGGNAPKGAMM